jgi:hypothetical protein
MIKEKDEKAAVKAAEAEEKMLKKIVAQEANKLKREGVIARRCEQSRKKVLADLDPEDCGSAAFFIQVPDKETEAKMAAL